MSAYFVYSCSYTFHVICHTYCKLWEHNDPLNTTTLTSQIQWPVSTIASMFCIEEWLLFLVTATHWSWILWIIINLRDSMQFVDSSAILLHVWSSPHKQNFWPGSCYENYIEHWHSLCRVSLPLWFLYTNRLEKRCYNYYVCPNWCITLNPLSQLLSVHIVLIFEQSLLHTMNSTHMVHVYILPGAHNEKERRTSTTSVSDKLLKMWSVFSL